MLIEQLVVSAQCSTRKMIGSALKGIGWSSKEAAWERECSGYRTRRWVRHIVDDKKDKACGRKCRTWLMRRWFDSRHSFYWVRDKNSEDMRVNTDLVRFAKNVSSVKKRDPFSPCTLYLGSSRALFSLSILFYFRALSFAQWEMNGEKESRQVPLLNIRRIQRWPCSVLSLPSFINIIIIIIIHLVYLSRQERERERRGRSKTAFIFKQIFRFSPSPSSIVLNDIRTNALNTYIFCSLSRWPQYEKAHSLSLPPSLMCNFLNVKSKNKSWPEQKNVRLVSWTSWSSRLWFRGIVLFVRRR